MPTVISEGAPSDSWSSTLPATPRGDRDVTLLPQVRGGGVGTRSQSGRIHQRALEREVQVDDVVLGDVANEGCCRGMAPLPPMSASSSPGSNRTLSGWSSWWLPTRRLLSNPLFGARVRERGVGDCGNAGQ
jgi:hypothetical protein